MKDKGFSLVELIVVILILGLIGVALAPQLMKYMKITRENSDTYYEKSIKSTTFAAVAEYENLYGIITQDTNYNVTSAGLVVVGNDNYPILKDIIEECMGKDYPKVNDSTGQVFQIQIWADDKKVDVEVVDGEY